MLTNLIQATISTHARAIIAVVGVAFITAFFTSPTTVAYLASHAWLRDLCGAAGAAYAAYVTYSKPTQQG